MSEIFPLTEQQKYEDALRRDSAEDEGEALLAAELSGLSALDAAAFVALVFGEESACIADAWLAICGCSGE